MEKAMYMRRHSLNICLGVKFSLSINSLKSTVCAYGCSLVETSCQWAIVNTINGNSFFSFQVDTLDDYCFFYSAYHENILLTALGTFSLHCFFHLH
jgi:hypothetical protein